MYVLGTRVRKMDRDRGGGEERSIYAYVKDRNNRSNSCKSEEVNGKCGGGNIGEESFFKGAPYI